MVTEVQTQTAFDFTNPPELTIGKEELTVIKMRGILQKFGFEFHPKTSKALIPSSITDERLTHLVGNNPDKKQKTLFCLSEIEEYLKGEIITDRFTKHEDRRAFRLWMESEEFRREAFTEAYERPNQLRINRITAVVGNMHMLARYLNATDSRLSEELINKKDALMQALRGDGSSNSKDYDHMTLEEKIKVVRLVQLTAIEALNLIAGKSASKREVYI